MTATDPEAGVNVTLYRVDGGPTMVYGGAPFTVSGEGQHTVLYWSNDKFNHIEAQNSAAIRIDSTLPTVQNSISGPVGGNGYYIGPVQFTMTGADNLSGLANIYYRVNGGTSLVYSSPFTIGVDGNHLVDYWSVDVAGNVSGVGTAVLKIDVSAPLTQATGSGTAGTNGWYRSSVPVHSRQQIVCRECKRLSTKWTEARRRRIRQRSAYQVMAHTQLTSGVWTKPRIRKPCVR